MDRFAAGREANAIGDRAQNGVLRRVEIFGACQQAGAFTRVGGLDEMGGGMVQRADERLDGVAALVGDLDAPRQHLLDPAAPDLRSEESRVGKARVRTCSCWWSPYN